MRFGINTWAYALPVDADNLDAFLDWAATLGLPGDRPLIEVFASPAPADLPFAAVIRAKAAARGFGVVACGFNPHMLGPGQSSPHLVSDDAAEHEAAVKRARAFIDFAAAVAPDGDPGVLSGPWHTRHMHFTGTGLTQRERARLADGLRRIASHAADRGVFAGIEVLNRFESYVLNTVAEALDVIAEVDSPQLGINWDSSHAHVDEQAGVVASLEQAAHAGRLFHVHICENHRGEFGTGQLGPFAAQMLETLRTAGYRFGVVPELFCQALHGAVHLWRGHDADPTAVAQRSIQRLAACV